GEVAVTGTIPPPPNPASWKIAEQSIEKLATGDVDGDGATDVVAAVGQDLYVMLDDGHGALGAPRRQSIGRTICRLQLADLDRDGRADVVVLPSCPERAEGLLLIHAGLSGLLDAPVEILAPGAIDFALGDFFAEGKASIAVLLPDSKEVAFYRNRTI